MQLDLGLNLGYFNGNVLRGVLDLLTVESTASYSLRKLKTAYTGNAIRVRRSADNAELDIPFATSVQTRTNLMPVPLVNNGITTTGITMTDLGSGTEFGLPYVDVRWQGTATVAGTLAFRQGAATNYNPAIHAEVIAGRVYTASLDYRLIAGTAPTQQLAFRLIQRQSNAAAVTFGTAYNQPAPTGTIQRAVGMDVIQPLSTYAHAQLGYSVAISDVVDFTIRFYANNLEEGIGNLRPLLQRNTPEIVANAGDLDVNTLNHFVNGENLLTFSEQFDNVAYIQQNFTSVTANNATAPNGTLTAETVIENTATSTQHRFSRSIALTTGLTYTFSCYVKRGAGSRQFQLGLSGGSLVGRAYFNLTSGTVGLVDQGTATITDAGNGWYRCSLTVLTTATLSHSLFFAMTSGTTLGSETYNGDGTSSMLIWGSQLNQGQLHDYNPTTTTAISLATAQNGFIPVWYDQGRYWNATRRNLFTYTENFDDAVWPKTGVTITANSSVAPNNTVTADTMAGVAVPAGTLMIVRVFTTTVNIGDTYTLSCWVRNATAGITFRLTRSGAGTYEDASINVPQSSQWQRISVTRTFVNAQTGLRADFVTLTTGDRSVEIWGMQLEVGSLTDYQPILTGTPLNMTQVTAGNQPRIVTGGAIEINNTKTDILNTTTASLDNNFGTMPQPFTRSYVLTRKDNVAVGSNGHYISNFGSTPNVTEYAVTSTTMNQYATGTPNAQTVQNFALNETAIFTSIYNSAVGSSLAKNGTNLVAPAGAGGGTGALNGVRIGGQTPTPATTGQFGIGELLIFPSALSDTDRQTLERNQGAYYGVTVA